MPNRADGKSTDNLPIAGQFRRSTFGLPRNPGDPMPEESAGLIANAQPEPGSGHGRPTGPYRDSAPQAQAYDEHTQAGPSIQATTYTPYDDRGDIGTVAPRFYAYDGGNPYDGQETGVTSGPEVMTAPRNPRTSTQMRVGNALWGDQGQRQ